MRASPAQRAGSDQLRLLEVVADSNLAHLSVESLLEVLLTRVQNLLQVDTAVVLLLDASGELLHATAARGLEEEVRQGVRIPVGKGFAGSIAARKVPVALDHVDASNVLNPILLDKGLASMLGVPLIVAGRVLGVLHVGCLSPRHFTEQETSLLQAVADRVALAVQARTSSAERVATSIMQRSLLPDRVPRIDGLEFASRYVPGEGSVGGDWYDVFALPSGKVCLVAGDVVSRGLTAALSMGQMRAVLRAYALSTEDPAQILSLLNDHVTHTSSPDPWPLCCARYWSPHWIDCGCRRLATHRRCSRYPDDRPNCWPYLPTRPWVCPRPGHAATPWFRCRPNRCCVFTPTGWSNGEAS